MGDMKAALDLVEPVAEVLGGLGDLDLIDYQAARIALRQAALLFEHLEALDKGTSQDLGEAFDQRFLDGWNKGAAAGHGVPAELRAALDKWHPPCPTPREDVEPHRLPPGREGAWPVQNFVSKADDRGNARRLLDHYGNRLLFAHAPSGLGEHAFDGQRWLDPASGGRGLAAEFADQAIESLPVTEAMSLSAAVSGFDKHGNPATDRGRYWTWLNAQQSDARRSAMIRAAAALPGKRVAVSEFDADPRWLNTPSGEVDLGRAEILGDGSWRVAEPVVFTGQHFPEHHHTRITSAPYHLSATCPQFEKALLDWLGDEELVRFVGKMVAASVRGLVTLKVLVILLGGRNSGKTTFLEVLMAVLGGYATTAQPTILRKGNRGGSTLSDDLDDLRGYRFVTTTETSGAEEMDEPRVKRLSGGDRVRARGLYKSSAAWDPFFILWLATNEVPRMSGDDAALWGRLQPVRFPFVFAGTGKAPDGEPRKHADPALKDRLVAEAPGILGWIIRHLELLYWEGLAEPQAVGQERCKLQSQQDTVGWFLAEVEADSGMTDELSSEIVAGAHLKIRFTRLLKHYESWAKSKTITAVGKDRFRPALENRKVKITNPHNIETVHGFGHKAGKFACPVCGEPPA
jgi:putative DNA primase/helicase